MKKFLSIMLVLFTGIALFASKAEVIKRHRQYIAYAADMNIKAMIPFLHPEFVESSSDGTDIDYKTAVKLVTVTAAMEKIAAGKDVSLTDLMEIAAIMEGQEFTAEMRQQVKAMEQTEQGKALVAQIKPMLSVAAKEYNNGKTKLKEAFKTYKFINCNANGNTATLVYKMKDADNGKMEETTETWVKSAGKWLIKKSVDKTID